MRKQKRENIKLGLAGSARITMLHVTCDWCVNQGKPKPSTFVTRATGTLYDEAARRGWRCRRSGLDVCPACSEVSGSGSRGSPVVYLPFRCPRGRTRGRP